MVPIFESYVHNLPQIRYGLPVTLPGDAARAARLALDHVLTRAGLALHSAEPLFVVSRSAFDQWGPYSFIHVIDYLAGDSR